MRLAGAAGIGHGGALVGHEPQPGEEPDDHGRSRDEDEDDAVSKVRVKSGMKRRLAGVFDAGFGVTAVLLSSFSFSFPICVVQHRMAS